MARDVEPRSQAAVWSTYDEMEARLSAGLSERMLSLGQLHPGQRVVDVASGRGEPAVRAAHRVAPGGFVVGIDRSDEVLELARARARLEAAHNIDFKVMDAETLDGIADQWADVALSRWGLMYFDSPTRALTAARRVLKPHGVIAIAVWADLGRVSYVSLPRQVLSRYLEVEPIDLQRPGPLYYAEAARLESDLSASGFTVEHQEELEVPVMEARSDAELADWVLAFGRSAAILTLPEEKQRQWRKDLSTAAERYRSGGVVQLGGVTRIVVARAR